MTALDDLVTFARIEVEAHDVEPWAEVLGALDLDTEARLWLVSLYNTYDDLGSAWRVFERWPSPRDWQESIYSDEAGSPDYPLSRERRGLRGGRVVRRLDSYASLVGGSQERWLRRGVSGGVWASADFTVMTEHLRSVWGVGRQSAFEWAEFLAKSCGYPLVAQDAQLWESSGPRHSLEAIYDHEDRPIEGSIDDSHGLARFAAVVRDWLTDAGVPLSWEDFETVVCDFHVMRKGRYYPGQHLAALRAEIDTLYPGQGALEEAWARVVPEPWCDISAGIDKVKQGAYARGEGIIDRP